MQDELAKIKIDVSHKSFSSIGVVSHCQKYNLIKL